MKKIIKFFALFALTAAAVFAQTNSASDFIMESYDSTRIARYKGTSADVTIPDGVITIGPRAFANNKNITSVTMPASVKTIGGGAFSGCTNLTSVSAPGAESIIGSAFINTGLIKADFPQVTDIEPAAFALCTKLTSVNFPKLTTIGSEKSKGYGAFEDCTSLTKVSFPAVTSIGKDTFKISESFAGADIGLTEIDLPQVTVIYDNAFENQQRLTIVSFPSVTKVGEHAFRNCIGITNVYLPLATELKNSFSYDTKKYKLTRVQTITLGTVRLGNTDAGSRLEGLERFYRTEGGEPGTYKYISERIGGKWEKQSTTAQPPTANDPRSGPPQPKTMQQQKAESAKKR